MRPLLLLSLLAALPCAAQQAAPASPLGIFSTHTGTWEGESWTIRGPQGKVVTRQRETVGHEAGGHVLTIHGLGTMVRAGKTDTIHHAFAIMHLSQDGTRLHMRAFTAEGRWLDPEITATPRGSSTCWKHSAMSAVSFSCTIMRRVKASTTRTSLLMPASRRSGR